MNILILGGGGREHALAWAFAANPKCDLIWCAPGNAGIAEMATCVALDILDDRAAGTVARLGGEKRREQSGARRARIEFAGHCFHLRTEMRPSSGARHTGLEQASLQPGLAVRAKTLLTEARLWRRGHTSAGIKHTCGGAPPASVAADGPLCLT